ncbi:MAG: hypothetical protein LC754_01885 [Acidobacteria bacterium]|nr:hypothetical protein [Acidobacteriota bacterium]
MASSGGKGDPDSSNAIMLLTPQPALSVYLVPRATEQSRVFDLLGQINYKILQGNCVYLRVCGTTYKVLYGVYWQSVFSGVQHWGLKCTVIEDGMWAEEYPAAMNVDLPLRFTKDGWIVEAETFQFLLHSEFPAFLNCPLAYSVSASANV